MRKAIDYIHYLQKMNERLKEENLIFKMQLQKSEKDDRNLFVRLPEDSVSLVGNLTPPDSSDSIMSPTSSDHTSIPSSPDVTSNYVINETDSSDNYVRARRFSGMGDQTRLAMCMFVVAIFSVNPLAVVNDYVTGSDTNSGDSTANFEGRSILGQGNFF